MVTRGMNANPPLALSATIAVSKVKLLAPQPAFSVNSAVSAPSRPCHRCYKRRTKADKKQIPALFSLRAVKFAARNRSDQASRTISERQQWLRNRAAGQLPLLPLL
jgi:hypothetical protein